MSDKGKYAQKNREIFRVKLAPPVAPVWLQQEHGNRIIELTQNKADDLVADGSFTTINNTVCAVLTADCVPLLLCNQEGTMVMAIHAGWRGICKGIIDHAVKLYPEPDKILVWIGPCVSKDYYEVGVDVFAANTCYAANAITAFEQTDATHWHCDLVELATVCLRNHGVKQVFNSGLCTYSNPEHFYSYRRDGKTGRTASLIWME